MHLEIKVGGPKKKKKKDYMRKIKMGREENYEGN